MTKLYNCSNSATQGESGWKALLHVADSCAWQRKRHETSGIQRSLRLLVKSGCVTVSWMEQAFGPKTAQITRGSGALGEEREEALFSTFFLGDRT